MSDQSLGAVEGVRTTPLAVSATQAGGVLALSRPADGTAGATLEFRPRQGTSSEIKLRRRSPSCVSMSDRR